MKPKNPNTKKFDDLFCQFWKRMKLSFKLQKEFPNVVKGLRVELSIDDSKEGGKKSFCV
jgi:hypothetical protein